MRKQIILATCALAISIMTVTPVWAGNWVQTNNTWEYHEKGIRTKNLWVKGSNNHLWYYIKADGKMASNEWVLWNGNKYYLHADGSMANAQWVFWKNTWYYINQGGAMAKSQWIKYKNDWYYVDANGAMLSNTTVEGYTLGADGRMLQTATTANTRPTGKTSKNSTVGGGTTKVSQSINNTSAGSTATGTTSSGIANQIPASNHNSESSTASANSTGNHATGGGIAVGGNLSLEQNQTSTENNAKQEESTQKTDTGNTNTDAGNHDSEGTCYIDESGEGVCEIPTNP